MTPSAGLYALSAYLYLIVSFLLAPVACVLTWRVLRRASAKGRVEWVWWLRPSATAATLTACSVLAFVGSVVTGGRYPLFVAISYCLATVAAFFSLSALLRLWRIAQEMPPAPGSGPGGREDDEGGTWPPPPRRLG